jgi:hypothetical protein
MSAMMYDFLVMFWFEKLKEEKLLFWRLGKRKSSRPLAGVTQTSDKQARRVPARLPHPRFRVQGPGSQEARKSCC